MKKKALFLDRDGTIILDRNYPSDPDEVAFIPGVSDSLRKAQKEFLLIVISNQSGVGRGLITLDQFKKVDQQFRTLLKMEKIEIAGFYYCTHAPDDDCDCRKPKPGMILEAAESFDIDLSESFMIGDKPSDVEAGLRAGCRVLRVQRAGVEEGAEGKIDRNDEYNPADKFNWGAGDLLFELSSDETKGLTDPEILRLLDERKKAREEKKHNSEAVIDLNRAIASILSGES